jgi:hypothetical protein
MTATPSLQTIELRRALPRGQQADWTTPPGRGDPIAILRAQAASRIPHLVPVRYQRLRPSQPVRHWTWFCAAIEGGAIEAHEP